MKKDLFLVALIFIFSASFAHAEYKGTYGSVTDSRDGYTYKTVKIGSQEWFAENLRTTKFKDGTDIPNGDSADPNSMEVKDRVFWYNPNGDAKNVAIYGRLYSFYAASKGICPTGWHAATDLDWAIMEMALGMSPEDVVGQHFNNRRGGAQKIADKLKATSDLWPESTGTNESGFNALPAGYRTLEENNHPKWQYIGERAYFLTTTLGPSVKVYDGYKPLDRPIRRNFEPNRTSVTRDSNIPNGYGFAVRCVKGDEFPLERQMEVREKGGKKGGKREGKKGGKKRGKE